MAELSDQEFVEALRVAVAAYLDSVDRWEAAYGEYYRLPGEALTLSSDMDKAQQEVEARRRELDVLLPRARQLCLKYELPNPLPGLLRISLGRYAPQHRVESAISRNERSAVTDCLVRLADACRGFAPSEPAVPAPPPPPPAPSTDRRAAIIGVSLGVLAAIVIAIAIRPSNSAPASPAAPTVVPSVVPSVVTSPPLNVDPASRANARFYRIEGRPMTSWGDYNDILQHGMTAHLDREHGLLSLERTGPYMPPITFPGISDVVLTAEARQLLESSGLTGFGFQPVNKTRIVYLPWNEWNLSAAEPPRYPESDEPEDYILDQPHDSHVAAKMGNIWELVVPVTAKIGRPQDMVKSFHELYLHRDSWNGADIFRGDGYGSPLVTERAKTWLETHFGRYVQFEEFACQ